MRGAGSVKYGVDEKFPFQSEQHPDDHSNKGPSYRLPSEQQKELETVRLMEYLLQLKPQEHQTARNLPTDPIANDYVDITESDNLEGYVNLLDSLVPTLSLGLQDVLRNAENRNLIHRNAGDANFNPINHLANYLMQRSPKHHNKMEDETYIRGLRAATKVLRRQLFLKTDTEELRIQVENYKARLEEENAIKLREQEERRREKLLHDSYLAWHVGGSGVIESFLTANIISSFAEQMEHFPADLREQGNHSTALTYLSPEFIDCNQFVRSLLVFAEPLTGPVFDIFLRHVYQSAHSYVRNALLEKRRAQLADIFHFCDFSKVGLLDRQRMLKVFLMFYNESDDGQKLFLRNPEKWPLKDFSEVEKPPAKEASAEEKKEEPNAVEDGESTEAADSTPVAADLQQESTAASTEAAKTSADNNEDKAGEDGLADELAQKRALELHSAAQLSGRPRTIASEILARSASVRSRSHGTSTAGSRSGAASLVSDRPGSHASTAAFDKNTVNLARFIQMAENFLSEHVSDETFHRFSEHVKDNYTETEDERVARIDQAKREALIAERRSLAHHLYEQWDNECQGWIDLDEIMALIVKYKYGQEKEAMEAARNSYLAIYKHGRVTKREIYSFLKNITDRVPGDQSFENLIDFISATLEISYEEKMRGELRRKWVESILTAAEQSGVIMDPVYRALFQVITRDAEVHGKGKRISAYVGMLEQNPMDSTLRIRFVGCTHDCGRLMLNKTLHPNDKCVSFGVIESGKLLHIPKVKAHGSVYMFHPLSIGRDGALVLVPLKDERKRVFGLLGVDNVNEMKDKLPFVTQEIKFYQGLAKSFSQAFQYVDVRRKILLIAQSASAWIIRRCPSVAHITLFIGEPLEDGSDFVLRKVLRLDKDGNLDQKTFPPRLDRKENMFRDYLFKCMDTSESVVADAYGERHLTYPLRDNHGVAVACADICLGPSKQLQLFEKKEIQRILNLLAKAMHELYEEAEGRERNVVLELEKNDDIRIEIMLDRLMLQDLRETCAHLAEEQGLAELRSYAKPPALIHAVVKSVLMLLDPDNTYTGFYENWVNCKKYLKYELLQKITKFDPTAIDAKFFPFKDIDRYIKDLDPEQVSKQGSLPTQYLYNWAFVSLSLIERAKKLYERLAEVHQQEPGDKNKPTTQGETESSRQVEPSVRVDTLATTEQNEEFMSTSTDS